MMLICTPFSDVRVTLPEASVIVNVCFNLASASVLMAPNSVAVAGVFEVSVFGVSSFEQLTIAIVAKNKSAIDFKFLFLFALFSVAGIFVGFSWASRVVSSQLKKIFGWLVLVIGVCIFIKEIFFTGFH